MPRPRLADMIDESQELLEHASEEVVKGGKRVWHGFADWAIQDNVLEVAVGLIIAAAFTTVVTSFVSDLLMPPLSLLPFINRNLDEKFAVLRRGDTYNGTDGGYNTLQQAADDGAVVLAYGAFIGKVVNFVGVGFSLYLVASLYECVSKDPVIKYTIKCRYCRGLISQKAQRCKNCTSWLDGREDRIQ